MRTSILILVALIQFYNAFALKTTEFNAGDCLDGIIQYMYYVHMETFHEKLQLGLNDILLFDENKGENPALRYDDLYDIIYETVEQNTELNIDLSTIPNCVDVDAARDYLQQQYKRALLHSRDELFQLLRENSMSSYDTSFTQYVFDILRDLTVNELTNELVDLFNTFYIFSYNNECLSSFQAFTLHMVDYNQLFISQFINVISKVPDLSLIESFLFTKFPFFDSFAHIFVLMNGATCDGQFDTLSDYLFSVFSKTTLQLYKKHQEYVAQIEESDNPEDLLKEWKTDMIQLSKSLFSSFKQSAKSLFEAILVPEIVKTK